MALNLKVLGLLYAIAMATQDRPTDDETDETDRGRGVETDGGTETVTTETDGTDDNPELSEIKEVFRYGSDKIVDVRHHFADDDGPLGDYRIRPKTCLTTHEMRELTRRGYTVSFVSSDGDVYVEHRSETFKRGDN